MASVVGFVRDLIFLPPNHDGFVNAPRQNGLGDVVRVQNLPEEHRDNDCSVCLEAVAQGAQGADSSKWVVMHPEPNPRRKLVHPIHLGCLAQVAANAAQSHHRLRCPECRADINHESLAQVVELPSQIVPKTMTERIVEEIPRMKRRIWKRLPTLIPIGCLPITGVFSLLAIVSAFQNPSTAITLTLFKCIVPSVAGGIIGVVAGSIFSHIALNAIYWLVDRMKLQPVPEAIVEFALSGIAIFATFQIASVTGSALSRLFLRATLTSAQAAQAIQSLQDIFNHTAVSWEKVPFVIQSAVTQAAALDLGVRAGAVVAALFTNLVTSTERLFRTTLSI